MIGPLSSQLNAIKWGEFRLGDLFEASNGDFDIQKRHINHKGEFVITAGLSNNGVLGQSDIKAKVFESHTITIDMFGCAFYRSFPYKMVTHARVFSLKPKFEINHKIGLFLSTLFFGYPKKFGYENMCSWVKIKNDKVILPLKPTANAQTLEDIDFTFMEKFIAELEQCRLAELEQCRLAELQAYLKATGLENTTLSSDEQNALNLFNNSIGGNTPCGLTWQSFRLGDLFEICTGRDIIIGQTQQGDIPLVSHQHENNGITKTIKEIHNRTIFNYKQTIALADRGVFLATTQNKDFHIGTRVKALVFKNGEQDKKTRLFFTTCINKNQIMFLDYSSNATNKLPNLTISLPTNPHGGIDFNFMHTLINALMKQTIQGVAQYCNAKIQATKEVINQETPVQKDSLF
ncbi:restriction endonuclease subunit S [Helicobacter pylori]|uniref:Type I restriction modification DNA specificity domain protein n=1 Tax=Helicobacter pylori Hp P-4 TaxID=992075 RepID=J0PXW9_HELPX|nr:restriction endonuclease subunit S [Helicobacter pylori]EJC03568.1 type I restriction modification DNA specificity domain protein [Helicobacter pylori Hp P-4]EJC24131.1 type I restriction modification DNA specificity domain protein [Helicobacter pylori Hp P-4c]EJC25346.1 type I restriction modification DNA specificity domain protein [Helicobacter pylori Hp P-4d]